MGSGSSRRRDAARVSVAEEGTGGNGGDDSRGAAQADNGGNTEVIHRQQSVHRTSLYPGTQEPPHSALRVDSLHGAADSSTEEDASFPPASVGQFDGSDNPVVASKRASGKGATHKRNSGGGSQQQPAGAEQSPGKKESWFKAAGRAKKKSKPTARPSVILRSVTCAQAHGHGCGCKRQRLRWHVGPVAVAAPVCACGCVRGSGARARARCVQQDLDCSCSNTCTGPAMQLCRRAALGLTRAWTRAWPWPPFQPPRPCACARASAFSSTLLVLQGTAAGATSVGCGGAQRDDHVHQRRGKGLRLPHRVREQRQHDADGHHPHRLDHSGHQKADPVQDPAQRWARRRQRDGVRATPSCTSCGALDRVLSSTNEAACVHT